MFANGGQFTQVASLQPKLLREINSLSRAFDSSRNSAVLQQVESILLIGSCSRGQATYRSDIDLLVILKEGPLTYARVRQLLDIFEKELLDPIVEKPLEIQIQFVLTSAKNTTEPAMKQAIASALLLYSGSNKAAA